MKQLLIIADGMADDPAEGPTALQLADTPAIDRLVQIGRTLMRSTTMPDGSAPGSDYAILKILGYSPEPYIARGPFEALGAGLQLASDETAYRCNFTSNTDFRQFPPPAPESFTTDEIDAFCQALTKQISGARFVRIDAVHAVAILNGCRADEIEAKARQILADHPVNHARISRRLSPVSRIVLWGGGKLPTLTPLYNPHCSIVVCGVPLLCGIAKSTGMDCIVPHGATGDLTTDYSAKCRAVLNALDAGYDFVLLHIEAPDTASHLGNLPAKIHSIEQIDRHIIAPLLTRLYSSPTLNTSSNLTITLTPDHATSTDRRIHLPIPFPFFTTSPIVHDNF